MTEAIKAYPLQWPAGWRTRPRHNRVRAAFSTSGYNSAGGTAKRQLSVQEGTQRVLGELGRMGININDIVISTNVRLRLDGLPRSDQAEPLEVGAAVYWRRKGKAQCMAIDRYDRVADNLGAVAATLEAMRAIERHGGGEILDRAFTGFIAIAAPEQWFQVLGVTSHASPAEILTAWRKLASDHHPDREGGDHETMARINAARDAGLEQQGARS